MKETVINLVCRNCGKEVESFSNSRISCHVKSGSIFCTDYPSNMVVSGIPYGCLAIREEKVSLS